MNEQLTWVTCDGGPHVLLPFNVVHRWSGIKQPSGGRKVRATFRWQGDLKSPASDYDAACDVNDPLGLVPIGTDAHALVLGDEVPMSTWAPSKHFTGGVLIVPMCWPSGGRADVQLLEAVASVDAEEYIPSELSFRSPTGQILLCAASDYGPNWTCPTLTIRIPPGTYNVLSAEVYVRSFELRLHALKNAA